MVKGLRFGFQTLLIKVDGAGYCLVTRPQYFVAVNRFRSHGPWRKVDRLSGIRQARRNQSDLQGVGESSTETRQPGVGRLT